MSDDGPSLPGPPPEGAPNPNDQPTEHLEPASGTPDAAVAQANRISRRTMIAALAALLLFGSCGVAYGVFHATRGGGTTTVTIVSPGPVSSSPSVSPTVSPSPAPGVDLVVSELTARGVTVKNLGTEASGRFVISVGGRAFIVDEGLPPDGIAAFGFACEPGPLTAVVDSTSSVDETDETNNTLTAGPFDCTSPTPSPSASPTPSPSPSPSTEVALPDLVVRRVTSEQVVVANVGDAAAGPFVIDLGKAGGSALPGLAAGESHTETFPCFGGSITAIVDANDQVVESDESNNSRSGGPFECLPDLVIAAIASDTVTIANQGVGDAGPSTLDVNGLSLDVSGIASGSKVTVDYACLGGQIQAVADVFDGVAESDEGNNELQVDVGPCIAAPGRWPA